MFEMLKSVPITIWSVALGSLITLGGVFITNWYQTKRLKIQLKHDLDLKAIERKAIMRRDVYLNLAEELVKASSYIGSLAQIDPTRTNIGDGLQDFFASAAKLDIIAEEETGKALNKVVVAYNALLFKSMAKIIPINDLKSKIDINNQIYDDVQKEIKRILAEMAHQNESGSPDQGIFTALESSFEFNQMRSDELTNESRGYWEDVNERIRELARFIAQEMKNIAMLQAPLMVAIRKELDIDTNIDGYRDLINKTTEELERQLDSLITELED